MRRVRWRVGGEFVLVCRVVIELSCSVVVVGKKFRGGKGAGSTTEGVWCTKEGRHNNNKT